MSRGGRRGLKGLGIHQRRVCALLEEAPGKELSLRELRRRLPDHDRSNLGRTLRLLELRGITESRYEGSTRIIRDVFFERYAARLRASGFFEEWDEENRSQ